MIPVLNLSGSAYEQGWQHGQQVRSLVPQLRAAMKVRLSVLHLQGVDLMPLLVEIDEVWSRYAPGTLSVLHGIADALELEWEEYFSYTVGSYLVDRIKHSSPSEGCTTWAAAGAVTRDGDPILAKNRDFRPVHQALQCLARARPEQGHPYLYLTSAGSPGVYSSGINADGLVVADTHVASLDTGPGIARYSLMLDLLERFSTTGQAVNYIRTVPHFGDGTVTVLDAQGDMAVFELAHSIQTVRRPSEGFLVSTNHFSEAQTRTRWVDESPSWMLGNSRARRSRVEVALHAARGQVDLAWSQALMASHGDPLSSICRHSEIDPHTVTIASAIYLPRQAAMYLSNGYPCQNPFKLYSVL